MADSFWQGTASGTTAVFTIPFPFLSLGDIVVQVDGVNMLTPGDYIFNGPASIQFRANPVAGSSIGIYRSTSPDSALVSFNNGAVLTAADLNTAALQTFYRTQELQDQLNSYITAGANQYSITGSNAGMSPQDLIDAAGTAAISTDIAQQLLNAVGDISTNAQAILDQTNRVDTLQATLDSLTSGVPGGIGTYLSDETDARIAGDAATVAVLAIIGAVSGGGTTFTVDTTNVYVDGSTSMADKFSGLQSEIDGNTAAITTEATTRASADSANATLITDLTTTVGTNTSDISAQLSSIDGLQAQYVVRLDVNGNVSGFGLASGSGGTSDFTVVATNFAVVDPSGGTPTVPFSISGGVVYMSNVVIGGALIQDLTVGTSKLSTDAVSEFYSASDATGYSGTRGSGAPYITTVAPITFTPSVAGTLLVFAQVGNCAGHGVLATECVQGSSDTTSGNCSFLTSNSDVQSITCVGSFAVTASVSVTARLVFEVLSTFSSASIGPVTVIAIFIKR